MCLFSLMSYLIDNCSDIHLTFDIILKGGKVLINIFSVSDDKKLNPSNLGFMYFC